jgi:dihydroneopterin aldolase
VSDRILVRDLRLWAHVGVLEQERQLGQWFGLDLSFDVDLAVAGASDRLDDTLDYAGAVTAVRELAASLRCQTLEHFSERILDLLQKRYGPIPISLELRKLSAPIPGFSGVVAVQRQRG